MKMKKIVISRNALQANLLPQRHLGATKNVKQMSYYTVIEWAAHYSV
jgi:hypothetical protein